MVTALFSLSRASLTLYSVDNCDLHFDVSPDGSAGQPLLSEKFPLLWSGCRLTHGVDQGKVGFEAKALTWRSRTPMS
uniref:Uncharacterized protein n=1 Tax=Paramormyrops kingsleyae TaxID=1676925 RepID=A0A3B3RRK6_9TELE